MDYEYYYNNARTRYYNACTEITNCENRLGGLNTQRQQKINQINQLNTEIKNGQDALEGVGQTIQSEEGLHDKILGVTNKTSEAAANYCGMIEASDVTSKNLDEVYGDETTNTKRTLDSILESLKTKKGTLETEIEELQSQLRTAEADLLDIDNKISSTQTSIQDWIRARSSASIDMEYYYRKMNEAV